MRTARAILLLWPLLATAPQGAIANPEPTHTGLAGIYHSIQANAAPQAEVQENAQASAETEPNTAHTGPAGIRHSTQRTAALQFGAQGGLVEHSARIRKALDAHSGALHSIYNFGQLLLDGYLLPPVISRGERLFIQDGPDSARETRQLYRIVHPARITSSPPFWQDYLHFTPPPAREPHPSLRPQNRKEQRWWDRWQQQGWQAGVEQADTIFHQNLARLHRDYRGMLLYHYLHRRGLVRAPVLGKTPHTTVNGDHALRLQDRILRLTRQAGFQTPENQ